MTIQNLMINHCNWPFSKLWFLCKLLLTRPWWKKSRTEDEVAFAGDRCADSHPWNCTAVGYVGHNAFISPWVPRLRKASYRAWCGPGASWRVSPGLWAPRSDALSASQDRARVRTSPVSDDGVALPGVSILPPPPMGFPARGFAGSWTVCALLFQVNNKVVHTEFFLREEPIKVSLVMESTLTRFVYFWRQDGLWNKDFFIIDFIKNCEAL